MADTLFPVFTVHCFFEGGHTVGETSPEAAHDAMEQHYRTTHADDVAQALAFLRRAAPRPRVGPAAI